MRVTQTPEPEVVTPDASIPPVRGEHLSPGHCPHVWGSGSAYAMSIILTLYILSQLGRLHHIISIITNHL